MNGVAERGISRFVHDDDARQPLRAIPEREMRPYRKVSSASATTDSLVN